MPSSRCVVCNKSNHYRNTRGSKLSNMRCSCGGKLESVGGSHALAGQHPFDSTRTYTSKWIEGEYFDASVNRKGEYFVYHEGCYHKIENPIIAKRVEVPAPIYSHNEGWDLSDMS